MDRDEILNQKTSKELEIERLAKFPSAPVPGWEDQPRAPHGVLLSDQVEFYCKNYKLLDPYKLENIKAANYELRVGLKYSVAGRPYPLRIGEALTIPRFEVAVIEILETINMPRFMIGRWNIRTKWAYEGLIWVGGPQVDAGYRGLIFCPIWNLSDADFSIKSGEEIAIIDFEFTTPLTGSSKLYSWNQRSRYLFEDYNKPKSGLVTEVKDRIDGLGSRVALAETNSKIDREKAEVFVEKSSTKIDSVTAIMFTALGVLTAAVAIFATKPDIHYWWDPTVFLLCWITSISALFAWLRPSTNSKASKWIIGFLTALVIGAIALQLHHATKYESDRALEIQQLTDQVKGLVSTQSDLKQRIEAVQKPAGQPSRH